MIQTNILLKSKQRCQQIFIRYLTTIWYTWYRYQFTSWKHACSVWRGGEKMVTMWFDFSFHTNSSTFGRRTSQFDSSVLLKQHHQWNSAANSDQSTNNSSTGKLPIGKLPLLYWHHFSLLCVPFIFYIRLWQHFWYFQLFLDLLNSSEVFWAHNVRKVVRLWSYSANYFMDNSKYGSQIGH